MFLEDRKRRCSVRSTWRLFLRLTDKHGVVKTMSTPLKVCNRHRASLKAQQVLDPRTWRDVVSQMMAKCGFRPKKTRTQLYYARCEDRVEVLS